MTERTYKNKKLINKIFDFLKEKWLESYGNVNSVKFVEASKRLKTHNTYFSSESIHI